MSDLPGYAAYSLLGMVAVILSAASYWAATRAPTPRGSSLVVDEGVAGMWFYHLRVNDHTGALCGARVLGKRLPMRLWGFVGHLEERYCAKCEVFARNLNLATELGPK